MEKTKIDLLIKNGAILTMNNDHEVIEDGSIAIKDNQIVDIGSSKNLSSKYDAEKTLDASDTVIMPGLIDTHFHTAQQFERGLIGYLGKGGKLKEPFWLNYLISFEGSLTDEDLELSALFAYSNLLKVGTTCFADAGGPRPEIMAPAMEQVGIRGILARSTLDLKEGVPAAMQDTAAGIVEKGRSLHKEWNGKANGRIRTWMAMRQMMICSREVLDVVRDLADELDTRIHIHLAEGTYEVDFSIGKSGKRPTEYLDSIGFLSPRAHAAHSVFLSDHELDLYQKHQVSVAHCPSVAFAHMGPTKVPEMLKRGIDVGLATDGALGAGGSLDLFRQMQISYHGLTSHYGLPFYNSFVLQNSDLLRTATLGGAKALRWDDEIGSLEKGKKADMVLLDRDQFNVLPSYDPVFLAASNAGAAQVKTVIVDGEVVVENRKLTMVDEEELKAKVKERTPKIVSRFLDKLE